MTRAIRTNCMIALRSFSPIRPDEAMERLAEVQQDGHGPARERPAPGHRPDDHPAPRPNIRSAVNSVVCPGSASPVCRRTRFPAVTRSAVASKPDREHPSAERLPELGARPPRAA